MSHAKSSKSQESKRILEEIDSFLEERAGRDRREDRQAPEYLNPTLDRRKQDRRKSSA